MLDQYMRDFFQNLEISLTDNPQQPGAEELRALLNAFNELVSLRDKLNGRGQKPLEPDEVTALCDRLQKYSNAVSTVIHNAADQKTAFSQIVADFMPFLTAQKEISDQYVKDTRTQRLTNANAQFKVGDIINDIKWLELLEGKFKACTAIVKGSSLIIGDDGKCDQNACKAMQQMEIYLKASPYYLGKKMTDAKASFQRNVGFQESSIALKLQSSAAEATPDLFNQLGFLIPFGLHPSKISFLYHRKIGSSDQFRESQRAAALAVVKEYLDKGKVSDSHGYVGLPIAGVDPKRYVQDALKTIAVCDYITREKTAAAEYRNTNTYPEKIKSGVNVYLENFFSSKKPNDTEKKVFDKVIEQLIKYSPAASFIYEDPSTLKKRLGGSQPEEKLAQLSAGTQPNILKDADADALAIMSELTSSKRISNSDSYNAVGDAMLRLGDAAHRPGGIVAEDYTELYKALRKYVYTHDSKPFTESGQKRFDAAAKLMVDVGLHLADLDPDMQTIIDRDFRVNTLRSKVFREYCQGKAAALSAGLSADRSSFVLRAKQIVSHANKRLAEYNEKMATSEKYVPVEMFTGKMADFQKQQELLEKVGIADAPAQKSIPSHLFTDISKMQNRTTSQGQMNQRLPISVELEDKRVLQGYFTENNEAKYKARYDAVFEDLCGRDDTQQPFYKALSKISLQKAATILRSTAQQLGVEDLSELLTLSFPTVFNVWLAEMKDAGYPQVEDLSKNLAIEKVGKALADNFYNTENLGDPALQKTFDMFSSYVKNVLGIYDAAMMNIHYAKVEQGGNLNLRNNAMYDVAKLLNHPDLICKTVQMSVTDNDAQKQGTFMLNAKGVHGPMVREGVNIGGRRAPVRILPACKRDMSRIEVLDYLCGNIDRHRGNFFMDARFVPDANGGHVDVSGLQGIDNDMSFGALSGKENVSRMSSVNHIRIMDKDQADAIQNMKPEAFENVMRGIGLSKEEIAAGLSRLSALQYRIKTSQIELVDGLADWNQVKIKEYALEADNIWSLVNLVEERGNMPLDKGTKEEKAAHTPEAFRALTEPKKMEIFQVRNGDAQVQINEQVFYLKQFHERFNATKSAADSPAYNKMRSGLNDFIKYAEMLSTSPFIDDKMLNTLADCFVGLNRLAKAYIKKGVESAKTPEEKKGVENRMNLAKNLQAFTAKGPHAIQEELTDAVNRAFIGEKKLYTANPDVPKEAPQKVETEHPLINGPY